MRKRNKQMLGNSGWYSININLPPEPKSTVHPPAKDINIQNIMAFVALYKKIEVHLHKQIKNIKRIVQIKCSKGHSLLKY